MEKSFGNHLRELLNNQTFISGIDTLVKNSTIKYEQIENLLEENLFIDGKKVSLISINKFLKNEINK